MAQGQGKRPAKLKADMQKEGSLGSLKWRLRQEKALDLVASRATITEVDPPAPGAQDPDHDHDHAEHAEGAEAGGEEK